MKFLLLSPRPRRRAFTLVELLVVMGIIAILAGVLVASVGSALKFAKRTKTNSTASQISTAVQNYYTEYGIYPTADVAGAAPHDDYYPGDDTGPNQWAPLIIALCGNINPYNGKAVAANPVPNTRNIAYMSPAHSDVDNTGRMVNPFASMANGVATAPAGGAAFYYMGVDTDYSGVVGDTGTLPPAFAPGTNVYANPAAPVPGGVAVWSPCDQPTKSPSRAAFWAHTY